MKKTLGKRISKDSLTFFFFNFEIIFNFTGDWEEMYRLLRCLTHPPAAVNTAIQIGTLY